MATVFPSIYRAKATQSIDNARVLKVLVPQVFGEVAIEVTHFLGQAKLGMGWVFFQGGNPEFPVWASGLAVSGVSGGNGGGGEDWSDEIAVIESDIATLESNVDNMFVHQMGQDMEIDDLQATDVSLDGRIDALEAGGGGGGVDEVWIGPSPPTGPQELWYDTDAPSPIDVPWIPMTLYNGWLQYAFWEAAEYRKVGKLVEIKGLLDGTSSNFGGPTVMPVGYRPPANVMALGYISDQGGNIRGAQRIDIHAADGVVLIEGSQYGVTYPCDFLSLHGISWYVA